MGFGRNTLADVDGHKHGNCRRILQPRGLKLNLAALLNIFYSGLAREYLAFSILQKLKNTMEKPHNRSLSDFVVQGPIRECELNPCILDLTRGCIVSRCLVTNPAGQSTLGDAKTNGGARYSHSAESDVYINLHESANVCYFLPEEGIKVRG
jgi:hypothetical protein